MNPQEISIQLCAIIFSDIRTPEKICKYFSCIPTGVVNKKLITEYIAFNVFIVDYTLYAYGSNRADYHQIKNLLFDKFVNEFWSGLYSNNMLSDDVNILNNRLPAYAEIYEGHEPNDSKKIGYCCAQILKFTGYKEHIDHNPGEYANFRFDFFDAATLALIKQTIEILGRNTSSSSPEDTVPSGNAKNMGCSLFILLAILAWLLS